MSDVVVPTRHQPALPLDRLILKEQPDAEAVPMDVVFVGGGPAGLAGAIQLAKLVRADNERGGGIGAIEIGVLEKAASPGEHCLSGAVLNPGPFRTLFPELADDAFPFRAPVGTERVYLLTEKRALPIPTPPTMRNHGNFIASICEVVRWLAEQAEGLGVNLFTGFPVASLLTDGAAVIGVRTTPAGLDRNGEPGSGYAPPTDIAARVTALAEGTRGPLTQAWRDWQQVGSPNPQLYALGVKEIWETKQPLDAVVHTMNWPLPNDAFGGSFLYPLAPNLLALGLVVGLDYHDAHLDVHARLQQLKQHPRIAPYLRGGELLEWGAKTIPEGGYFALPDRLHGDGVLLLGDAAGFVEVASLKGIHYAVQSGILAAHAIFEALKRGDVSATALASYDRAVRDSFIVKDLRERRNMRLAFKGGFYAGGVKSLLMTASRGMLFGRRIAVASDAAAPRRLDTSAPAVTGELAISKLDAVFKSGNATRDDIPSHLIAPADAPPQLAEFYQHMCPAGVYERQGDQLVVNAPNCIDCKATDVLGPRWTPREGGSGPKYRQM